MWWLLLGPTALVTKLIIDAVFKETPQSLSVNPKTILEQNFDLLDKQLVEEKNYKKKVILIVGQPGAGKSTLLKIITDSKCDPLPVIGQQTDATDWHSTFLSNYFHRYNNQSFVDTPGYDSNNHRVECYTKSFPFAKFDHVLFVISGKIHESDELIFRHIKKVFGPNISRQLIFVRGFSENVTDENEIIQEFDKFFQIGELNIQLVMVSNRFKNGIDKIRSIIS